MKKVFAASLILASTIQVSPVALKRAANVITGTVAAAVVAGPQLMARASIAKKYTSLTANQRLGTTPVYYVANSRGNAFLQEDMQAGRPDQKCVVYFLSYEDAADYLEEMAQSNALNAHEFHVVTISMEKVVDNIATRKQSRKLGRYPMDMVYRLQPSSKQCENAEVVAGKGDRARGKAALKGVSIPMFSAPGLVIQRAGTNELVTPYYFALEDLQEDWQRMLTSTSSSSSVDGNTAAKKVAPAAPKVVVHDFAEVMCLSQGISKQLVAGQDVATAIETIVQASSSKPLAPAASASPASTKLSTEQVKKAVQNPGFVPPRREIEMLKSYYRHKGSLPGEFSKAKLFARPE